jgi:hypothetical protein
MLSSFRQFVKDNIRSLILTLMVFLISLLSFALGYLIAKYQGREPIRIETPTIQENN